MSSLSKIVISGKVIRQPEMRYTPNNNVPVTEFAIAVEQSKPDGSVETHAVKIIAWRDLAERLASSLKKGDFVAVDGRCQINKYTNSEGQRRTDIEVDAIAVDNLTQAISGGSAGAEAQKPGKSVVRAAAKGKGGEPESEDLDAIFANEDEIPF